VELNGTAQYHCCKPKLANADLQYEDNKKFYNMKQFCGLRELFFQRLLDGKIGAEALQE
jgi:hypothetical protein